MTLQQLYYIVELSKHNSISAAAQALFIAQPSLSTAIKELEKEFHITILERSRHGITFTSEGLEFLNYAHYILEQTTRMREHFTLQAKKKHSVFLFRPSITCLPSMPSFHISSVSHQEKPMIFSFKKSGRVR